MKKKPVDVIYIFLRHELLIISSKQWDSRKRRGKNGTLILSRYGPYSLTWKKKKLGRFSRLIFSVWPCWPFRGFVWGSGRTLRWPGPRCRPPWGPSSQLLWPDPVDTGKWPPQPRSSGSCRIAWKERWNLLVWKAEAAFKESKLFK